MTSVMTQTEEKVEYENGRKFNIYSKMTKIGIRYYRYSRGRFFPISKNEINQRICVD